MKTGPQLLKTLSEFILLLMLCTRDDILTSWCVVLTPAVSVGESWSWGIERNVADSQLESWPLSLPRFVAVLNQKEERYFFLCWSASAVMWKSVLEENQQWDSEDFERLGGLCICACWGNTVGRGQWPSLTLLLNAALWCCHVWTGYQFLWSPWQAIFISSIVLLMYIGWPKGCTFSYGIDLLSSWNVWRSSCFLTNYFVTRQMIMARVLLHSPR